MRLRYPGPCWPKTLAFTGIHLLIAVVLGRWFTGSWVLGGLWALVEPLGNTLVHHQLDAWWARAPVSSAPGGRWAKSACFGVAHLGVALAVGYALTGNALLAGALAVVEPAVNTVAHHLFDRWWAAGAARAAPAQALPSIATGPTAAR